MSHSERAAYYRRRVKRWQADLADGTMELAEARGWIVHDLKWARFHEDLAAGKMLTAPDEGMTPLYTLEEAIVDMPEDVDAGDPDDVYSS